MLGIRRPDGTPPHTYHPGDYGLYEGAWHGRTPNGLIAGLANHSFTVHDDNTVSFWPSIKVDNGSGGVLWHGYLTRGVWS